MSWGWTKRDATGRMVHIRAIRLADSVVAAMHTDYQRGLSFAKVGKLHPLQNGKARSGGEIRELFKRRGLAIRPLAKAHIRNAGNPGCFVSVKPPTAREITAMILGLKRIIIPDGLRLQWRKWSLQKRGEFIASVRTRLKSPDDAPTGPCSRNVEPFDYSSERAHTIARKMNSGQGSHQWRAKLKLKTQGMIWQGQLFYWSPKTGYHSSGWTAEHGRPLLHHIIWEKHHRRPVPAAYTIIFKDGNWNNLEPSNLALKSRSQNLRENHATGFGRRGSAAATTMLERFNQGGSTVTAQIRSKT